MDVRTGKRTWETVLVDIPFFRCTEEVDYRWRLNFLLEELDRKLTADVDVRFSTAGHNPLCLIFHQPPYDCIYWVASRDFWSDVVDPN